LLFAFFGISLTVRKRSLKTELRSVLATKRKIVKLAGIGGHVYKTCLFRDPTDDRYPFAPEGVPLIAPGKGFLYNWFVRDIVRVLHDGIVVRLRDALAYLADDGIHWDYISLLGDSAAQSSENRWECDDTDDLFNKKNYAARYFWANLPENNKASLEADGFIPYEAILAVDEDGDGVVRVPTIFVQFESEDGPFSSGRGTIRAGERRAENNPKNRVSFFPTDFPAPPERSVEVAEDK